MNTIILLCAMVISSSQVETVHTLRPELQAKVDEDRVQANKLQVKYREMLLQTGDAMAKYAPMLTLFILIFVISVPMEPSSIHAADDGKCAIIPFSIKYRIWVTITVLSFAGILWYTARFSSLF